MVTTKQAVLVENLLAKADKLGWRINHENSFIATIAGFTFIVSHDLIGYIVTLTDDRSDVILSAREKACKDIYEKARSKALDINLKMQEALRILETLV